MVRHVLLATAAVGLFVTFAAPSLVAAQSVVGGYWNPDSGGNGHSYEIVTSTSPVSWSDAEASAEASGGYLATITSAAESNFVWSLAPQSSVENEGVWLGGYRQTTSTDPNVGWNWVSGEPWSYTQWQPYPDYPSVPVTGAPPDNYLEEFHDYQGNNGWGNVPNLGPYSGGSYSYNYAYAVEFNSQVLQQVPTTKTPVKPLTTVVTPSAAQLEVFNPSSGTFGSGTVNPSLPTIVLTHGWQDSPSGWVSNMAGLINADIVHDLNGPSTPVNIVAWNWSSEADTPQLGYATSRTQEEGAGLGEALSATLGSNYQQPIHFLGHSLGTLVDAEAVNVFHSHDPNSQIQDTLFDDAEVANLADGLSVVPPPLGSPLWATSIPEDGSYAYLDNYISAVGNLHPEAVNVVLTQGPTDLNPVAFHSYPQQWYSETIGSQATQALMGFRYDITQGGVNGQQPLPGSGAFIQSSTNELTLNPVSYADAEAAIAQRDATEVGMESLDLTIGGVNAAIQTEGQVQTDIEQASQTIGASIESVLVPKITLTKGTPMEGAARVAFKSKSSDEPADSSTSSVSSYAWLPITIPSNAQYLSLNFTFHDLSQSDFLSVGINDTPILAIESQFITDGASNSSGLLDVSQWSGQNVSLFLGLVAGDTNNGGGTMAIDDIQFDSVPEPGTFALLTICGSSLLRRRRARATK
jgi:hypothetical protein